MFGQSKCGSHFKPEETLSMLYKTQEQSLYWFILTLFQRIEWQEPIYTSLKNNLIIEGLLKFEEEISHGKHNIVHIRLKQLQRFSVSNIASVVSHFR